jgi:hypothetical protein
MIKVGDKVFHAYNGKLRGVVKEIRLSNITHSLDAGPPSKNRIAVIEVFHEGKVHLVESFVKDLMVDV